MTPRRNDKTSLPSTAHGVRTLLVDDCPVMLSTLTKLLARDARFLVVGTAVGGRQAIISAASLSPQLVVVDLHLPELSGAEVTRCIKQFETSPIVFMVTSDDSPTARARGIAAGVDAFLIKSDDLAHQLKSRLQECFGPAPA